MRRLEFTDDQKALLEARLADMEQHPEKSIPWEDFKARLSRQGAVA
jgi:putative addiction module component (TIGR02574 family)